jgi:hypothetical protein
MNSNSFEFAVNEAPLWRRCKKWCAGDFYLTGLTSHTSSIESIPPYKLPEKHQISNHGKFHTFHNKLGFPTANENEDNPCYDWILRRSTLKLPNHCYEILVRNSDCFSIQASIEVERFYFDSVIGAFKV